MNFWTNPETAPVKAILLVAVLAVAGFFVFTYLHKNPLSGKGTVIDTSTSTSTTAFNFSTTGSASGSPCTMTVASATTPTQSITMSGTTNADGTCTLSATQPNAAAQGLYAIVH